MVKLTDKIKKQAKELKEKHNVLFVNSKGEFFTSENFALASVNHDKKKVREIKDSDLAGKGEQKGEELTEQEAKKALVASKDFNELDYHKDLLPIVNALGIETEDNKKETIVKALEEFKEKLKAE